MIITINHALQEATKKLAKEGKVDGAIDARLLLSHITRYDRVGLIMHGNEILKQEDYHRYIELVEHKIKGVPVQYLIGEQEFMGITFKVNQNTLIPRRETEELVELALDLLGHECKCKVIDIGTGSGCIPISLTVFNKYIECIGIDVSDAALGTAKLNGEMNHVNHQINWIISDLFSNIPDIYIDNLDMIISNPPYIKSEDISSLMVEVRQYEPVLALDGGCDGLSFYKRICSQGRVYLKDEGYILFEIGHDQKEAVMNILEENNYRNIKYKKDLSGLDRIVYAQK